MAQGINKQTLQTGGGGGAVESVNGQTGIVVLDIGETLSGTIAIDFGTENDRIATTISSLLITNTNIKGFSYIPMETTETSLDDFTNNNVMFNIENIVDNVSFDITGSSGNNATGNYTIKYLITY